MSLRHSKYTLNINTTCPTTFAGLYLDEGMYCDEGYTYTSDLSAVEEALAKYEEPLPDPGHIGSILDYVDATIDKVFPRGESYKFVPAEEAWKKLDLSTSAGITHPGKTKREALELTDDSHDAVAHAGEIAYKMYKAFQHTDDKVRNFKYPCKIALKPKCYKTGCDIEYHDGECDHIEQEIEKYKVRTIWVAPIEGAIFEQCYYQSFYEKNKKNVDSPMLMGKDAKMRVIDFSTSTSMYTTVSLDWSGFDQKVPSFLCYYVIKALVDRLSIPDEYLMKTSEDDFKARAVKILTSYFIHTCVVLPNGKVFQKHHGIPSGSAGTQLIGTLVNMIVIQWLLEGEKMPNGRLCCLGDDSRFETEWPVDQVKLSLEAMKERAKKKLGMELHPEKCEVNPAGERNAFLGFAGVGGAEVVDEAKFEFKLRFASYKIQTYEEELIRFIGLYISGGYALDSYQKIALKLKESGGINPYTGEQVSYEGIRLDKTVSDKLKYVFGIDLKKVIAKVPEILSLPNEVLRRGATLHRAIFRPRYRAPNALSHWDTSV